MEGGGEIRIVGVWRGDQEEEGGGGIWRWEGVEEGDSRRRRGGSTGRVGEWGREEGNRGKRWGGGGGGLLVAPTLC